MTHQPWSWGFDVVGSVSHGSVWQEWSKMSHGVHLDAGHGRETSGHADTIVLHAGHHLMAALAGCSTMHLNGSQATCARQGVGVRLSL